MRIHNETTRFGSDPLKPQELANKAYVDSQSGASPLTTKGDLFGFSSVDDRIPIGSNDQVLTADSTKGLGLKWSTAAGGSGLTFAKIVKTIDETIQSDSTLSDDSVLKFTPTINKVYIMQFFFFHKSGSTPDIKLGFSIPTGSTIRWTGGGSVIEWRSGSIAGFTIDAETPVALSSTGADSSNAWYLKLVMGSTAGDCALQWAQNLSTATDTTVQKGSMLIVWEEGST